ncbi:MAG TPA: hypothetical protein PKZ65_10600, partial [Methanoregulaceae archaeon]|nr:hypothetical protein [Methanoregulaceae archaeon]
MVRKHPHFLIVLLLITIVTATVFSVSGAPLTGTITPISVQNISIHANEPAISGDRIVWRDGNYNIHLYDITTGIEQQLTPSVWGEEKPVISGHYIAWQDDRYYDPDGYDIVLYDLDTDAGTRIAAGTGEQTDPSIDDDLVVWQDTRNGVSDIYLYSISSETETQVTSASGDQLYPRVSGDLVTWQDASDVINRIN